MSDQRTEGAERHCSALVVAIVQNEEKRRVREEMSENAMYCRALRRRMEAKPSIEHISREICRKFISGVTRTAGEGGGSGMTGPTYVVRHFCVFERGCDDIFLSDIERVVAGALNAEHGLGVIVIVEDEIYSCPPNAYLISCGCVVAMLITMVIYLNLGTPFSQSYPSMLFEFMTYFLSSIIYLGLLMTVMTALPMLMILLVCFGKVGGVRYLRASFTPVLK